MKHVLTKCGCTAFLIVAFICGWSFNSYAQSPIGVQVGMNFSSVRTTDEQGKSTSSESMSGIRIGLTADFQMVGDLYVQPAIFYSQKGFREKTGGLNGFGTNFKARANYWELPITFIYKPQFGNLGVSIGAGFYGAYGTGGNWESDSGVLIGDIQIGSEGDVIFRNDGFEGGNLESYTYGRPMDYGANFLLGYQLIRQLSVQVQAQVGLANLTPKYGDFQSDRKFKNSNFAVSLGYSF